MYYRSCDGLQPQRSTNVIGIRLRHEEVKLTDNYNNIIFLLSLRDDIEMAQKKTKTKTKQTTRFQSFRTEQVHREAMVVHRSDFRGLHVLDWSERVYESIEQGLVASQSAQYLM